MDLAVIIRKGLETDYSRISQIVRENLIHVNSRDYPQKVIQSLVARHTPDYLKSMAQRRDLVVAVFGSEIVGTASLEQDRIYTVFVDTRFHNLGIGRKLMNYLENLAKERGLKSVQLHASLTAFEFYKKLGYSELYRTESEDEGQNILMEKKLV